MTRQLEIYDRFKNITYMKLSKKLAEKRNSKFDGLVFIKNVSKKLGIKLGLEELSPDNRPGKGFAFGLFVCYPDLSRDYYPVMHVYNNEILLKENDEELEYEYDSIKINLKMIEIKTNNISVLTEVSFIYKCDEKKPSFNFIVENQKYNYPSSKFSKTLNLDDENNSSVSQLQLLNTQNEVVDWILLELENIN